MLSRIVGDNIDFSIERRFQTKEKTNQSIHWTQQYAIKDRINDSSLSTLQPKKQLKDLQLVDVLPVKDVQECFKKNCAVLVSRVISKYCAAFKHMHDVVTYHISHIYSQEMEQKSKIVICLLYG